MEYLHGPVVISIKESTKTIPEMVKGRCIGQMEATTEANGRMGFNMEEVNIFLT